MINEECECYETDRENGECFCRFCGSPDFDCSMCVVSEEEKQKLMTQVDDIQEELDTKRYIGSLEKENQQLKQRIMSLEYDIEKLQKQLDLKEIRIANFAVDNSKYVKLRDEL